MISLPLRIGKFTWADGAFYPQGPMVTHGPSLDARKNPRLWRSGPVYAARLFMGFHRQDGGTVTLDDVVGLVHEFLLALTGRPEDYHETADPGASFVTQEGLYRYFRPANDQHEFEDVREPGAQIILVNLWDIRPGDWKTAMQELGDILAAHFGQREVIVEIQRGGVVTDVYGMGPE